MNVQFETCDRLLLPDIVLNKIPEDVELLVVDQPTNPYPEALVKWIRDTGRGNQNVLVPIKVDRRLIEKIDYSSVVVRSTTLGKPPFVDYLLQCPLEIDNSLMNYVCQSLVFPKLNVSLAKNHYYTHEMPGCIEWTPKVWIPANDVLLAALVCVGLLDNTRSFTTSFTEREVRRYLEIHLSILCVKLKQYFNYIDAIQGSWLLTKKPVVVLGRGGKAAHFVNRTRLGL